MTISDDSGSYTVLCHAHLPVVAFTGTPPMPGLPVRDFMDVPLNTGGFEAEGLRVLSADELGTPVARLDLGDLARAERVQIRHWRPQVLGDLLFNWWD
ncbi:hypothetical protein [Peterkaempfera griseoplana]|uniref:hypothetical protein n=1 Tax=Peterkaempfera griseoplana TaxID=66896 RepID=UPI0012FECA63|nr:hypothetical protein [Peterkaempfera griseoplana]